MKIQSYSIEHKDRKDEYGDNLWEQYAEIECDGQTFIIHASDERGLDRIMLALENYATSIKVK